MGSKYSQEQKLAAVQAYMNGEGGIRQIARNYDVSRGALIQWVAYYKQNHNLPNTNSENKETSPYPLKFKLEVLYWQQVHNASDLKTSVTFKLKGMEIVSKWRKYYLQGGKLRLIRTRDGVVKTIPKAQKKVIVKVKKENAIENKTTIPKKTL